MSSSTEIDVWSTARTQISALKNRDISVRELLEIYRQRIARYNPELNAVVIECFDRAEVRAAELDGRRSHQVPGPLFGLPMTVKESLEVEGLQTTGGVIGSKGRISKVNSPHVRSLLEAGMTLMGKTNIPTGCADLQADSPVYGRTDNPWNVELTPGGSSGGSAAALAAGLTPLEIGTDIGGSIRVPANFCGVYGLRPSETAVPRWGHFPGNPVPNPSSPMSVIGPLARDAGDLELTLDIISQPDPGEGAAWTISIPAARWESLAEFRVGMLGDLEWVPLSNDVRTAQQKVRQSLVSVSTQVVDVDPETLLGGSFRHHLDYLRLLVAIVAGDLSNDDVAAMLKLGRERDGIEVALRDALYSPPSALFGWFSSREEQRARYRDLFTRIDVLIAPIALRTAFPHVSERRSLVDIFDRTIEIDGVTVPYDLQIVYPGMTTFAGQPSVAFPVGMSSDGLPVGLQAIGPYLEDRSPVRFAELIAEEIGGFTRPPGFE
jgi:amidase